MALTQILRASRFQRDDGLWFWVRLCWNCPLAGGRADARAGPLEQHAIVSGNSDKAGTTANSACRLCICKS